MTTMMQLVQKSDDYIVSHYIAMYHMVSYDILWTISYGIQFHCTVFHAFAMLASERGLCLARHIYFIYLSTIYNETLARREMVLFCSICSSHQKSSSKNPNFDIQPIYKSVIKVNKRTIVNILPHICPPSISKLWSSEHSLRMIQGSPLE